MQDYISLPSPDRTPDRLSVLGKIYGYKCASISSATVLDLGCGQAADIIALATTYPNATFVGVDNDPSAIQIGNNLIQTLNLKNVTLICQDILDYTPTPASFDYILCHGTYSWVPETVSDKILAICNSALKSDGLAYISYNAMPAWATRAILSKALRRYTRGCPAEDKVAAARSTIAAMQEALIDLQTPYAMSLKLELDYVEKSSDSFIAYELLSDDTRAYYLEEFTENAAKHNLYYLAEAKFERMLTERLDDLEDAGQLKKLIKLVDDPHAAEALLDFVYPTWLRQAVLAKKEAPYGRIAPREISELFISSSLVPTHPSDPEGGENIYLTPAGVYVTIHNIHLQAAIKKLYSIWPKAISVKELYESCNNDSACSLISFSSELVPYFSKGLIELHSEPSRFKAELTEYPKVFAFTREQLKTQNWVTNLRHEYSVITDLERHIIDLADGTNSITTIQEKLKEAVERKELNLKSEFLNEANSMSLDELIKLALNNALEHIRENALLI